MTAPVVPSIDQLQVLPSPVSPFSYVPQTWGWLVLLLVVVFITALWGIRRWQRWQRDRYRREALEQLEYLQVALSDPGQRLRALRALPALLKRVALSMADTPAVQSLSGDQWQAFLNQRAKTPLPDNFARRLFTLAYAPDTALAGIAEQEVTALFALSKQWIEAHHVAV